MESIRWVRRYLIVALMASILLFGAGGMAAAHSQNGEVTVSEAMLAMGGSFGTLYAPVAQGCLGSIDVPSALALMSLIASAKEYMPEELAAGMETGSLAEYSFGLLDYGAVRGLIFIWFVVSKLSRSNRFTYTTGVILEELESKLGAFVHAAVAVSQFLANFMPEGAAEASGGSMQPVRLTLKAGLVFLALTAILLFYIVVRMLFFFVDILLLPICSLLHFSGFLTETAKTAFVWGMGVMMFASSGLFAACCILLLALGVALFRRTCRTVRYFREIYVSPLFGRGKRKKPSLPKQIQKLVCLKNVELAVPVFFGRKHIKAMRVLKHERWWLIKADGKCWLCRRRYSHREALAVMLEDFTGQKEIFVKTSKRFTEIFTLQNEKRKKKRRSFWQKKDLQLIISKDYRYLENALLPSGPIVGNAPK